MIKVLIIDDSAIVRQILSDGLSKTDDIEVVGTAVDPFIGRDKIIRLKPDVITLDIEMPRMDGLAFLRKLMEHYPLPVVIVSSVTEKDPQAAIKALQIGAFDVVNKPGGSISAGDVLDDVIYKIRQAYKVRDTYASRRKIVSLQLKSPRPVGTHLSQVKTTDTLIAIGSSTGGTVALEYLFTCLPPYMPPILVVQHMPENYTYQFAQRLNSLSRLKIKESEDGELIAAGTVYIAKGGFHMETRRKGRALYIRHTQTERVCFQRPSVDVLFNSLCETAGGNVLGVVLTGMGSDGADGLLNLRDKGADTIAQDKETSVVWGMPQAAAKNGAADRILALDKIPDVLVAFAESHREL